MHNWRINIIFASLYAVIEKACAMVPHTRCVVICRFPGETTSVLTYGQSEHKRINLKEPQTAKNQHERMWQYISNATLMLHEPMKGAVTLVTS